MDFVSFNYLISKYIGWLLTLQHTQKEKQTKLIHFSSIEFNNLGKFCNYFIICLIIICLIVWNNSKLICLQNMSSAGVSLLSCNVNM